MFYSQGMKWVFTRSRLGGFGNYGADSEAGKYLQNNEETQGYEELQNQTDVAVFKVFAKDRLLRDKQSKFPRSFKQFKNKIRGGNKSSNGFRKMKANIEQRGGRHQIFEEKKARLSKAGGGLS